MRILVLEDNVDRRVAIAKHFMLNQCDLPEDERDNNMILQFVNSLHEFRHAIMHEDWDIISLDHDLGDEHKYGNGMEAVDYLIQQWGYDQWVYDTELVIVCHSGNPDRQLEMRKRLIDAGFKKVYTGQY